MTGHNLRIWALIQAELVTAEGMRAENDMRLRCGNTPAYSDRDFEACAKEIRRLAESFEPLQTGRAG